MTFADSVSNSGGAARPQPASVSGRPRSGTRGSCPNLVGRAEELDRLGAAFDAVAGGRALAVLIGGDAGIGKSRIVEEFCDRVRLRGAVVAAGLCVPAGSGLPYAPVMGILRDLGRQLDHPPAATEVLRALGADVDPTGSAPERDDDLGTRQVPVAGEYARTMFFESILQALVELARTAPMLLLFEDLQWADSASSQLIDFLVRNLADSRVLVLGTYRSEDFGPGHPLTPWLAELSRHARVQQLVLGPLTRAQLSALVVDSLGERPEPARLESIWTRSQGNPFFAEELIAAGDATTLPTALQGVIITRVEQCSEPTQDVLGVVATSGAVVGHELLVAVEGQPAEALVAPIREAIDKRILVVDESGSGYQFRHALLREAVYDALLPAQRIHLHRTIAGALTADPSLGLSSPSHLVAELAAHWWAAGDWAAALKPSVQAAEAAIAVHAFAAAMGFLERALLASDRAPGATAEAGTTRASLLELAADIAYLVGTNARAVELARAAVDAIDAQAHPVDAARCLTLLGRNTWGIGDSAGAFDCYRKAVELLPADAPSAELARLRAEEARGYLLMSLYGPSVERAREAIAVARAVGARDVEGHALNTLGCCRVRLGFPDEGIPLIRESVDIAEDLASPDDLNRAYGNLSASFIDIGRLDDAASVMFDSAAVGEELWGIRLNGAASSGVEALIRLGRYEDADQVLAQLGTQALGVCAPSPWTLPSPMLLRRGRFDAAERSISVAMGMTARLEDVQQAASVLGHAAELDLERGRPDDAAGHLERALELALKTEDETLLPELCALANRAIADQREAARAHGRSPDIEAMRRRADEMVATIRAAAVACEKRGATVPPRSRAAEALAAAERSRLDEPDPALWEEAARLWGVAQERYPLAYCRWRQAEAALESRAGRARAQTALNEAWQIACELGAEPLAGRVTRLAQRGRLELHDDTTVAPSPDLQVADRLGLTAREVEVLGQLAAGRSDREIGQTLFISKKTVSVHVSNVLRKLAVPGRVEAGKIGQTHGLGVLAER